MVPKRFLITCVVAMLVISAGCLGNIAGDDDTQPDDSTPTDTPEPDTTNDTGTENTTDNNTDSSLPDAGMLLERLRDVDSTLDTIHGVQTTTTVVDGVQTATETYEVWLRPPDAYRYDLVESDNPEAVDVSVSNGTTAWRYYAGVERAVNTSPGKQTTDGSFERFADLNGTVTGTTTIADRPVYVVELTGSDESGYESATLWLDQDRYYPLKQRVTSGSGNLTTTTEFEDVSFDDGFDDDRFEFAPSGDTAVVDLSNLTEESYDDRATAQDAVPFPLPDPALPSSLVFDSVEVREELRGLTATLRYSDSDGPSVTVRVAEAPRNLVPELYDDAVEIDGTTVVVTNASDDAVALQWVQNGRTYTVAGAYDRGTLLDVVRSISATETDERLLV